MSPSARLARASLLLGLLACGDDPPAPDLGVEAAGPHPVGTARFTVDDAARGRALTVQAWYPADPAARAAADAGFATEAFEDEPRRAAYADLLAAAPAGCPTRRARAAPDAAAAPGAFPLIVFSHCHNCTRFSSFTVAERLASHGFVVVAPDHADNTLFDWLAGTDVPLGAGFLPVRAGDVRAVVDAVVAGGAPVPAAVAGAVDPARIGALGHSFGSVTAGLVAQDDPRIGAALGIAAPMENPLLAGVSIEALDVPLGFLVAVEDNSITELGNTFIRDNFALAPGPAWKVEVADAGHWSFSDLVGLAEPFPAGCGDGTRQTDGQPFTYLPPETGRAIAAAHVTAFFRATLQRDAGAAAYLTAGRPAGVVTGARR